jgi:hypothetical protein
MNTQQAVETEAPARSQSVAVGSIEFAIESFRDTVTEAIPMLKKHGLELGLFDQPWDHEPKLNMIAEFELEGGVVWITARKPNGELVGYALFFIVPSLTFKDLMIASCEWVYLARESRRVFKRMLRFCEAAMAAKGCGAATFGIWGVETLQKAIGETRTGRLLRKLGYEAKQISYWKSIRTEG